MTKSSGINAVKGTEAIMASTGEIGRHLVAQDQHLSDQDQQMGQMRDRQTRIETSMEALTGTVRSMADTQERQQSALSTLTGDVQSILTLLKTKDGRIDIRLVLSVIVPTGAFMMVFLAMYISPLKSQVDGNQTLNDQRLTEFHKYVDQINADGTVGTQRHFSVVDTTMTDNRERLKALEDRERVKLEEQAAVGRAAMRHGFAEPSLDHGVEIHK
jgi:hypothetical protein